MKKLLILSLMVIALCSSVFAADIQGITEAYPTPTGVYDDVAKVTKLSIIPFTLKNLYTTNYVVPTGYNLLIPSAKLRKESDFLQIKQGSNSAAYVLTGRTNGDERGNKSNALKRPLGLSAGDTLSASNDNTVSVIGFLISSNNVWKTITNLFTTPYSVPDSQILVITNVYAPRRSGGLYVKYATIVPPSTTTAAENKNVAGSMESGAYYYKVSYLSSLTGKESGLSSDSVSITVSAGDTGTVVLSSIPVTTKSHIDYKKIYRSEVDDPTVFKYLKTITNATTTDTDSANDTALGAAYVDNNTAIEVASQYLGYNIGNIDGDCLESPIFVDENNVISAAADNIVINGYLTTRE